MWKDLEQPFIQIFINSFHYSIYSIILSGNYWAVVLECANEYPCHKNGSSQLDYQATVISFAFRYSLYHIMLLSLLMKEWVPLHILEYLML